MAAFVWGVENLIGTLGLIDNGNSDWAFGQVVPVVLLAAPLLSLFEYLYPGKPLHPRFRGTYLSFRRQTGT